MDIDTALCRAAKAGDTAKVRRLLAAGAASDALDVSGWSALGLAALWGHADVLAALLAAGASPTLAAPGGMLPILGAVMNGHLEAVRLLLEAAPATAGAASQGGWTALSMACAMGKLDIARRLLATAPEAANMAAENGDLPVHFAALGLPDADTVSLLLAAAPHTAAVRGARGFTPLHCAARAGNVAAVRALLAAAPGAELVRDASRCLPLDNAVLSLRDAAFTASAQYEDTNYAVQSCHETALCLIEATPPADCLAIATHPPLHHVCLPLFPHIVACHALTEGQWQHVPSPCAGLAAALPVVFRRSAAEAALLVAHLPPADQHRLRTAALCLTRTQNQLHMHLPAPLVGRILSFFDAA